MAFHRRLRRIGAAGVVVGLVAVGAVLIGSTSPAPGLAPSTQTFTFTGGEQTYAIPAGTAVLHIVAVGGAGAPDAPGPGAVVTADVPVPDGVTQLYVEVGGNGADTGTGPGASEVRTCSIADASCGSLVVAGGAGATESSLVVATALTGNVATDTTGVPSVTITPGPRIDPGELPSGTVGAPYSQQLTAQHGGVPVEATFVLSAGTLPPGVTLSPAGLVAGTPTTAGSFAFTVDARDAFGFIGRIVSSVEVAAAEVPPEVPPVAEPTPEALSPDAGTPEAETTDGHEVGLEAETLPGGRVGEPYSEQLDIEGSPAQATFSLIGGVLPRGLMLSESGLIAGTPRVPDTYTFTIRAAVPDVGGVRRTYTVSIGGVVVTPRSLPAAVVNQAYFQQISLTRDRHPVLNPQLSLVTGTLPPGVTLAPSGAIGGTPTTPGTFRFKVEGTARGGSTAEHRYKIVVTAPPPPIPGIPGEEPPPTEPTIPGVPDFPDGLFGGLQPFGEGDDIFGPPTQLSLEDLGIDLLGDEAIDLLGGDLGIDLLAETGTTAVPLFWFGAGLVLVGGVLLLLVPKQSRRDAQLASRSTV